MRKQIALVSVAVASFPLAEVAYAIAHRWEPQFVVCVLCALAALVDWVRGEPAIVAIKAVAGQGEVNSAALVAALRLEATKIAARKGSVTADDLRPLAANAGIALSAGVLGHVFRWSGFRRIGQQPSQNRANHGRPIGVYALGGSHV